MYISDEQIRALYNLTCMSPNALNTPEGVSRGAHRLAVVTDCSCALGLLEKSALLSEDAEEQLRDAARARCAEHIKTVVDAYELERAAEITNNLRAVLEGE